jgi:hemoglobin/transferrin/lactoferrin receptor protein
MIVIPNKKSNLRSPMRRTLLATSFFLTLSVASQAQENGNASDRDSAGNDPETIVVTATRSERDIADVPATVSVLTAADIENQLARDLRDLVRYEPGVSVGGTGDRFGLGGFTIRGIGGNRVLTTIDGIRVADAYSFGPFLSANRDYVDVDGLSAFEIVRGPGSALYGSDAIGGVVAYRTKGPSDYLAWDSFYGNVKAGYSGDDDSTVGTLTIAGGLERLGAMVLHTARQGHETENFGGTGGTGTARELPDPLDRDTANTVLKLAFAPGDAHELVFGTETHESDTSSRVLSNYDTLVGSTLTRTQDAYDTIERDRYSIAYTYAPASGAIDRLELQLYSQTSEQQQTTQELRESTTSGIQTRRTRDSFFEQEIDGLNVQIDKTFGAGRVSHYLVAGLEHWTTDSASLRDGGTTSVPGGAPIPEFSPLPTRDFPPTEVVQQGVFVQDEIALLDGRLVLTPALRFDAFDADATGDAVYFAGNPGQAPPENFSDSKASPKLGALYRLTDRWSLYTQYAEGFKAPPYDDVNVGFTNPIGGYKTISNPDLVSETSRSKELGLRLETDRGRLSLVAFQNTYDDFIESLVLTGVDPDDGFLVFQSQNLDGVEIEGFELSGRMQIGQSGFGLNYALAYAEGTDEATGEPLNSIDPLKSVLGLSYAAPSDRWGGEIVWTALAGKDAGDISGDRLATPGYGLIDVLGRYRIGDSVQLNFGIFNLTDKRYIEWADTPAIAFDATSGSYPEAARFTRPGINAGMSLRVEF